MVISNPTIQPLYATEVCSPFLPKVSIQATFRAPNAMDESKPHMDDLLVLVDIPLSRSGTDRPSWAMRHRRFARRPST